MAVEYKHSRYHLRRTDGVNCVHFFQNTVKDVKMGDTTTETIRGHILYRTPVCTTASNIKDKEVDCDNFTLKKGVTVTVSFEFDNSSPNPTLNVAGTGAKVIKRNNENITTDFIISGHVYMFNYNGECWDLIGSDGAMKVVKYLNTDSTKRYVTAVTGEGNNKNLEINDSVYTIGDKMYGDSSNMVVKFDSPEVNANNDYRATYEVNSGFGLNYLIRNIKVVLAGLSNIAFKEKISTSDVDTDFTNHINDTITKSTLHNSTANIDAGTKALDAAVGYQLDQKIANLDTKLTNLTTYQWDASSATLNIITN